MRIKVLAVAVFLALAACGSAGQPRGAASQSTGASAEPSHSPSALSSALFAIATGLPGGQLVTSNPPPGHATVKIVDANGRVYAEASFAPPPAPVIGNAEPLLQSPVRTAGGAVFYADSTGAVHRLKADGSTSLIATFPLTNAQQELSYAVSPDGAHLIAIVLSTPPLHNPPAQTLGDPIFQEGGHWTLKLETADAGGSTTTTLQRDLGVALPAPTEIVGWDKSGPLATLNTQIGAQQAPASAHLFGTLIHLAPDGTHLEALGGPNCTVVDELSDGTVVCDQDWQQFSVRSSSGASLWQASLPSDNYYYGLWLSPDANAVAVQGIVVTRTSVASAARHNNGGQSQLVALGWLDANTVIEASSTGQLSLYEARSVVKIRDLGFSGIFEGLL
jgi:hypothetical protein